MLFAVRECYVLWLSQPIAHRYPRNEKAFAKLLGVSQFALFRWKVDPALRHEVLEGLRPMLSDSLSTILQKIAQKAERGNMTAIRLWMEFHEVLYDLHRGITRNPSIARRKYRTWRQGLGQLPVDQMADAVQDTIEMAAEGNVAAARLILGFYADREKARFQELMCNGV